MNSCFKKEGSAYVEDEEIIQKFKQENKLLFTL